MVVGIFQVGTLGVEVLPVVAKFHFEYCAEGDRFIKTFNVENVPQMLPASSSGRPRFERSFFRAKIVQA